MLTKKFEVSSQYRKLTNIFLSIGGLTLILGIVFLVIGGDQHAKTRFWAILLQSSVFFLMVANAAMFFICAVTLAQGGWHLAFVRIPEAISKLVPILSILCLVVFASIIFGHQHHIYHWIDNDAVSKDSVLQWKSVFLNPFFFFLWTIITLALWSFVGYKIRKLSEKCNANPMSEVEKKKFIWKGTVLSSIFIVFFALTTGSTIPWLWLMSIDAHWYSTMYSWYTFATTFVAGMALITLFTVYMKRNYYLPYVTDEHFHDLGKFMFAFSIFWTYLWFSQFMLIWYANIPEETVYFKIRFQGPYQVVFFANIIINFILPFLILMTRESKRNYNFISVVAVIILLGHWMDFFQMVIPGALGEHYSLGWYEFGILCLFIGIILYAMGRSLSSQSLFPTNHPYSKESLVYHT